MTEAQKNALVEQCYVQLQHAVRSDNRDQAMDHFNRARNLIQELHYDVWHTFHTSGIGK